MFRRSRRAVAIDWLEPRLLMAVQPVISEFMADNESTRADPDGVFSDWIELFNPNPAPLDIGGYFLTDAASHLTKWKVPPGTTISASGYALVWANSTEIPIPSRPLYANFAMSKEGEYLALVQPDGVTITSQFSPAFPPQEKDVSYGLLGTNVTTPVYGKLSRPTPGAANPTTAQIADVQFSVPRGFYTSRFTLTLSTPTAGATIRYTLDGETPDSSSPAYDDPISIDRTTVVRAAAFKSGTEPSVVVAQTYLFVDDVIRQPKNLRGDFDLADKRINKDGASVPQDTEMDPSVVDGHEAEVKAGLQSIPTLSLSTDFDRMFGSRGVYDEPEGATRTEQPVSVELIDPANPGDNDGVFGIVEGQSHDRMKRSLRLSFKPDNGGPGKWKTDLLKNAPWSGKDAPTELDNLVLRAGNNRSWARGNVPTAYTEDEWYRSTQVAASGEGSHGTFVHLYINGAYWGLYNLVERPDEKRYAEAFGLDDGDIFAIDHDGDVKGNRSRWDALMNTVLKKDMSKLSNFSELEQYVDVPQFAEYLAIAWYQGTTDWPDNNWWAAGPEDGKFRFYAWDGEKSWDRNDIQSNGAYIEPQFKSATNTEPIVRIFRAATRSNEFKLALADAVYRLTNGSGPLSDAAAQARWDALNSFIAGAVWGESARWGDSAESESNTTFTKSKDWTPEVANIRGLMSGNATRLISLLKANGWYPSTGAPTFAQRGGNVDASFKMSLKAPSGSGVKVYYTLDGTDPRLPGGKVSPVAKQYTGGSVTLSKTANVVIRALSGSANWGPKDQATFTIDLFSKLRIVEMMYNPAGPAPVTNDVQDMEFLEVQNTGKSSVNLDGVSIDGIGFTFLGYALAPGAFAVIAKNAAAYAARYPGAPAPAGVYGGNLDNGGETIKLLNPDGGIIQQFRYEDGNNAVEAAAGWLPVTDGGGRSLMIVNALAPLETWNLGASWRASDRNRGTPGTTNAIPVNQPPVVTAAAPSPVAVGQPATLTGSATDDELPSGSTVTLAWSKTSGPGAVTFAAGYLGSTTAVFAAAGTYVLRLTASDGVLSAFKELTVVVNAANQPPVLTVTAPTSVALNKAAQLQATAADDNLPTPGTTRPITWSKISGPGDVTFTAGANASITLATFAALGDYVLEATTTDGAFTVTKQVAITVTEAPPPNTAPTVNASVQSSPITLPATASLSATVQDDGQPNAAPALTWTKLSGPGVVTFADRDALNTTAAFSAAGTYVLRAAADDGELTGVSDVTVVVATAPVTNAILSFTLVDGTTGAVLRELADGDTLNLATLPSKLNVIANAASGAVKSVRFAFDLSPGRLNRAFRIDSAGPFTLFAQVGDIGGGVLAVGSHTLIASPFAGTNATGGAGGLLQVRFTVVNVGV